MTHRSMTLVLTTLILIVGGVAGWGQGSWKRTFGGTNHDHGYSIATATDGRVLVTGTTTSNDGDFEGLKPGSPYGIVVICLDIHGEVLWKRIFGGTTSDYGYSITTTLDGGILITGINESNGGDFEGITKGGGDIFVIKLDRDGDVLWIKTYGGKSKEYGQSITTTSDGGVLIIGSTSSNDGDFEGMKKGELDICAIKLDTDGELLWKKTFGGSKADYGSSIVTTTDGGVLITGTTSSNDGDFVGEKHGGRMDVVVIKLDRDGNVMWMKTFGGTSDEIGRSITTTSDGGILITGGASSLDGDFEGMIRGQWDIFIFKLDGDGDVLWKKTAGGSWAEHGYSITTTSDDGILIAGEASSINGDFEGMIKGETDIFVVKLDRDGEVLWKKTYGGTSIESGRSMSKTAEGGILVTGIALSNDGDFEGMNVGRSDICVFKLDKDGNLNPSTSVGEQTLSASLRVSPNPISTSSTITYNMDNPSLVRIELLNTLGQVVEIVFDGYRESGSHAVPVNLSTMTSGIYSVRMISDARVQTTPVCVVR